MTCKVSEFWWECLFFFAACFCAGEPGGKLIVRVADESTGEPIAGAQVFANVGIAQSPDDLTPLTERLTDKHGRFEMAVPWGNLRLPAPILPVGYWPTRRSSRGSSQVEQLVITRSKPVVERTFWARRGIVWPLKIQSPAGTPLDGVEVHFSRTDDRSNSATSSNAEGIARITLPKDGGKFSLTTYQREMDMTPTELVRVEIDPDFDPLAVADQSLMAGGKRIQLTDRSGRRSVWEGVSSQIHDGRVQVVLAANNASRPPLGTITGAIVDEHGEPVTDAVVQCLCAGLSWKTNVKRTNERGEFQFQGPIERRRGNEPSAFRLTATKAGYAGIFANHFFQPDKAGTHKLMESLVLRRGCDLPVRILDDDDNPLEGAWVEYYDGPTAIAKTDELGNCLVKDLPAVSCQLFVNYGDERASPRLTVDYSSRQQPAVDIRLAKADAIPSIQRKASTAIPVGELAPEWHIRDWSDGGNRTLASQRGKVVVVDFWSLGCAPCRQVCLPVENKLHEKYGDDVVFITIHPAGTQMHLIKELFAAHGWKLLVGLDEGPSESESHTLRRYGIQGYPTKVIIDRNGRVLHNSADGEPEEKRVREMQQAAAEIGLPWPIESDADQNEIERRLRCLHEYRLTKEIDKALALP